MKIIRISAMWCSSCLVTYNDFNKLKDIYNCEFIELDYDFDDISKYNIGDILPVVILLDDSNNELARIIGEKSFNEMSNIINEKAKDIN